LPAHENFVDRRMPNVTRRMRHRHWRILEENQTDISDSSRLNLGLERLPT
jgi:hypothetical protein